MTKRATAGLFPGRSALLQAVALVLFTTPLWWGPAARFLSPDSGAAAATSQPGEQPRLLEMEKIIFLQDRAGKREIRLEADSANSANSDEYLKLFAVTATVADANGSAARITGDEALFEQSRQAITLSGHVRAILEKLTASAERASYFAEHRKFEATAPVKVATPQLTLTGGSLSYDLASGNLRMGSQGETRVHCLIP